MIDKGAFRIIFAALSAAAVLILTLSLLTGSSQPPTESAPTAPLYTLRSVDGRIGVFGGDTDTADYYLDTPVSSLPEYDRNLLQSGIAVYSEEELNERIADLDG